MKPPYLIAICAVVVAGVVLAIYDWLLFRRRP